VRASQRLRFEGAGMGDPKEGVIYERAGRGVRV